MNGGARHEAGERVVVRRGDFLAEGWTINRSRGGIRIVVENSLEVGGEYTLAIEGDGAAMPASQRPGRVVWTQEESDGQIVGLEFLDVPSG